MKEEIRKSMCITCTEYRWKKYVPTVNNPNHVAAPEMKLLELSIWEDGYTMALCMLLYSR